MISDMTMLLGRLMMATLFLVSGLPKILGARRDEMAIAGLGLPAPAVLTRLTGLFLMAAVISLVVGFRARIAVAGLALFVVVVTPLFHPFWDMSDAKEKAEHLQGFLLNVALLGGLLAFYANGPGRLSMSPAT